MYWASVSLRSQFDASYNTHRIRNPSPFFSFETQTAFIPAAPSSPGRRKRKRNKRTLDECDWRIEAALRELRAALVPRETALVEKWPVLSLVQGECRIDNPDSDEMIFVFQGSNYLIPGRSSAIQSDWGPQACAQLQSRRPAGGYRLIVLDPPWQSKSVKRSHRYVSMEHERFCELPIKQLVADTGAYVLVWITNDPKAGL